MPRSPSQKANLSKFVSEKRYCAVCSHHLSFHQLITRDKWSMFEENNPLITHQIPWFCEFTIENPITHEERICGCTNLRPTTQEEVQMKA